MNAGESEVLPRRRVDRDPDAGFDAGAMPQPSHIYASTLDRRDRRWRPQRTAWTATLPWIAALGALLALGGALLLG
jgi:hypothetical protein